ncbi:MAG: hypothetical protein GY932_08440 [Arcobacter sp.]|nr:hypothetical protein [Arcobacter sp.]
MDFNKLDINTKENLHLEITSFANSVGGKNFFLKMIEEIRDIKPNPLLNKSGSFHTSRIKVTLTKSMFKDTFNTLFESIRREDKSGDMLNGIAPKEYKATMNMMRALAKVDLNVAPKKEEDGTGFHLSILDTSEEKKTKVTFIFKVIFFYHLDEAKKALSYKS